MEQIIAQAAEAVIIKQGDSIIKRRIKKGYRIQELDEKLRKLRTRSEAKLLEKSSKIISVPKLINANETTKEIEMEFIEGKKLSEHLDNLKDKFNVMEKIGNEVAKLHDSDIIHGDLTTSNMILVENNSPINEKNDKKFKSTDNKTEKEFINSDIRLTRSERARGEQFRETKFNSYQRVGLRGVHEETKLKKSEPAREESEVCIIDFGLGFISKRMEDRAVDLHLIKQALEAKHFKHSKKLFKSFLNGYNSKDKDKIFAQLKIVESRGRYRKH